MNIRTLLQEMVTRNASDLYLTVDSPPMLRIEGITEPIATTPLNASDVEGLAYSMMTDRQRATFEDTLEMNLAMASEQLGRFRVNVFRQRGAVGAISLKPADR